jgi:hypothetical protein
MHFLGRVAGVGRTESLLHKPGAVGMRYVDVDWGGVRLRSFVLRPQMGYHGGS